MSKDNCKREEPNDWDDDDGSWDNWEDAEDYSFDSKRSPEKSHDKKISSDISATRPETISNSSSNKSESRIDDRKWKEEEEPRPKIEEQPAAQNETLAIRSSGWGGLFGGVVSSVLTSATEGLGNFTSTVSQGLDKVIGVPDPAELARINKEEEAKARVENLTLNSSDNATQQDAQQAYTLKFGTQLVSGVTNLGSKVISTGLDTLEGIGKKTMDILQENDPQIKHKIKMLALEPEKPNLSEILKLAKAENEQLEESLKKLKLEKNKSELRFDVLFERYCGLVHWEAIEILSKESQLKIDAIKEAPSTTDTQHDKLLETLTEVEELMELEECDVDECGQYTVEDLKSKFQETQEETQLNIEFVEIINLWSKTMSWLQEEPKDPPLPADDIYSRGVHCLSEMCALEAGRLHKISELLLVKTHHRTASEVVGVVQLCSFFIELLQILSNGFASKLDLCQETEAKSLISNLFAEMLQARQQIEKALRLFLPILQLGAT